MKSIILLIIVVFTANIQLLSNEIQGSVWDENGNPLIGATVMIDNDIKGTKTDSKGKFSLKDVKSGIVDLKVTYIGYKTAYERINVNKEVETVSITLETASIRSKSIEVVASRAEFRETPVAFSQLAKVDIERNTGADDLTMALNETPGVFATMQGGGSGDSRINIRGFDQRNISVLINGVPVNDMENGWVYWSNWDGLKDITSSYQVQRGLGAGKLANPSVGGTLNILTDAADQKMGFRFSQDVGSGNFSNSRLILNTGLQNGFAATLMFGRKISDGLVEGVWTDAWSYYGAFSWDINDNHQLDFYVVGAPQSHGQRSWRIRPTYYSQDLVEELGMSDSAIAAIQSQDGTFNGAAFNTNWNAVSNTGKEYYLGKLREPRFRDSLNETSNFYHKPQMNLNWFWKFNKRTSLTNVVYLSLGNGGGSGRLGYFPSINGRINFEHAISSQRIDPAYSDTEIGTRSILRNSVNNHFWYGYLGTLDFKVNKKLRIQGGLDLRSYQGEHFREVRNLFGADYYVQEIRNEDGNWVDSTSNINEAADRSTWVKREGDKIDYYNDGLVDWVGGFYQMEYKEKDYTAYMNVSLSNTAYQRIDYFRPEDWIYGRETEWKNYLGYTAKFGFNYNINRAFNVYTNIGYYSRAPLFNAVFDFDNEFFDPENEKVLAFELGTGYWSEKVQANLNVYYTNWRDKAWTQNSNFSTTDVRTITDPTTGEDVLDTVEVERSFRYLIPGSDAVHFGVELDGVYRPIRQIRFKAALSFADWTWVNNPTASYNPDDDRFGRVQQTLYMDGIKVGDAPQSTMYFDVSFYPVRNSYITLSYRHIAKFYSDFNPRNYFAEPEPGQNVEQPWQIPSYGLVNLFAGYTLRNIYDFDISFRFNVFNLLNNIYISDADSALEFPYENNAFSSRVHIGLPRRGNFSMSINY